MNVPQVYSSTQSISFLDILRLIWRRLWLILLLVGVCVGTSGYLSRRTPRRWRASAELILIQRAPTALNSSQSGYAAPMVETTETQVALLQGYAMAQKTLDLLKNEYLAKGTVPDTDGLTAEQLQKTITVTVPRETNLVDVFVEAETPERAELLANAVCRTFVQWKKEVSQQNVQESMTSITTRSNRARQQMLEAERQEMAFRSRNHMVDVPVQSKAALDQYLQHNTEVSILKQEIFSQDARLKALMARLKEDRNKVQQGLNKPDDSQLVRDDTRVLALQQELNKMEMDRAEMALRFTPDFPGILDNQDKRIEDVKIRLVTALRGTLDDSKPSIQAQGSVVEEVKQLQITRIFNQAKFYAVVKQRDNLKRQIAGLPQTTMDYTKLARNAEQTRGMYSSLQAAIGAMRIDKDMAGGNVQIAQYAYVPFAPFQPNRTRDLMVGAAVGLCLAAAATLLLEQSDRRVRTLEQARRIGVAPIIGSLPRLGLRQGRQIGRGVPPPRAEEAYSLAAANLVIALRQPDLERTDGQVLLITSALPGEGKSVTSAELAKALARTGRTVILVDADLRRPAQNRQFNTVEMTGLADVLEGRISLEHGLVDIGIDRLSILYSGIASRSPTELLSSPRMTDLLNRLRRKADVVVVDAPACSVVADALLLAPYADGILYVIGAGIVDDATLRDTTEALRATSPKSFTYFVNRAPMERSHAYKYYSAYNSSQQHPRSTPALSADSGHKEDLSRHDDRKPPNA